MTVRPATLARDDQVMCALRHCDNMATTMEVAAAMSPEGGHAQALYAVVYGSLVRLERAGMVDRRRFQYNSNTYWHTILDVYDLSALEWTPADGEQS